MQKVFDEKSAIDLAKIGRFVTSPRDWLVPVIKTALYQQSRMFVREFRLSLDGKFKVKRSKVGNSFKSYVAGDSLSNVRTGIFTRWKAARVYEYGEKIVAAKGAMSFPINPRAFTPDGRVKKKWRDPRNFPDLVSIKTKRGTIILIQGTKEVKTSRVQKKLGLDLGEFRAFKPMFVLIKSTRRTPTLRFFQDFEALSSKRDQVIDAVAGREFDKAIADRLKGVGNA
jgi:hypothetical protein